MIILVMKCLNHPHYLALREPKIECEGCHNLWSVRQDLDGQVGRVILQGGVLVTEVLKNDANR